ncbi:hypothetical protein D4A35_03085 [Paraclostridium bifermentans]|uniref:Nuclease SbcCD subunit C n=1 Tax=Paraclostridium bifermentans TaxID=1490 RepID=A0A5P3X9Y1_PARBF|nr:AAA family ATPase [Paraclostridium bifermentans]QEZ67966.1 hypothetical protein D4A35_03085 [Paraclostridium bifermentans]
MKYFINRIYIKNFKFIEESEVIFNKSNLVMLDGPNGYGKTSIFDAIELVITGRINRINKNQTDNISGCNDILYLKNQNLDLIIKVEFLSGEDKFTIAKRIDAKRKYGKKERKSNNWNLFETYLLKSFDDDCNKENKVELEKISELFEESDLDRFYNLFYYIQQEDSSFFLKENSEQSRLNVISKLFDTEQEKIELDKLESFKKKINDCKANLKKSKKKEDLIDLIDSDVHKLKYEKLISWKCIPWDMNELQIATKQDLDKFIDEVNDIKLLKENQNLFFKHRINKNINKFINQENILKSYIVCGNFYDKYELIDNKYKKMKFIQESKELFNCIDTKKLKNFEYKKMFNILNLEDSELAITTYEGLIEDINKLENNQSDLDKHIKNLDKNRLNLYPDKVNKYKIEDLEENRCILCGNLYSTEHELKKNIDNYAKTLENIAGESYKINKSSISILEKALCEKTLNYLNEYLNSKENIVDENFYMEISKYISVYKENIEINKLFKLINLNNEKYINKKQLKVENLHEKYNELNEDIFNSKYEINEDFIELDKKIEFEKIYKNIFELKKEYIESITLESIENKINYIKNKYYNNQLDIKRYNKDIQYKIDKIDKIINEKLQPSIELYKSNIRSHYTKIIKEIEIPFYIYSGKIIQDYQRGLGLFIKEYDEIKNLKFVSSNDSDHDAVNYLSSGQLSALVISFTLALNKVYGNKHINTILIDDPVQTMDDINIISFVELIRNEFKDKQIIISTHEDEVSLFMRYKFLMHNLKETRINVKDCLK